jgi:hypothetical protein
MNIRSWILGLGTFGLGLALAFGTPGATARAEEGADETNQEGVQVQGRGPVHEAYAEPSLAQPAAPPVVPKQPPDPVEEVPPDQKPEGENVQWVPGYWAYDEDSADFLWVSGLWRDIPPGQQWMPGHWTQTEDGWQWTPGFWAQANQEETEVVPPPPKTIDVGPSTPAPAADYIYVPGIWVYRQQRFFWRPGFWYRPQPRWVWVPAHYVWTPGGYLFVEGYWDYPLRARGVLFAPVVIERRFWTRPNWVYRPRFVVYDTALVGALFVRPDTGSYYFGDYFAPTYRRRGFVSWVDYRVTRYSYDPLFTYVRWQNRTNRYWERDLRTLYVNRWNGKVARPPRTIVQQNTLIKNITVNKGTVVNIRNVTVLAPITKVDRTVVKLRPVTKAQLATERKAIQRLRTISVQRQKLDAQVLAKGKPPVRPTDRPQVPKIKLPRPAVVVKPRLTVKPPAPPVVPKGVEKKPLPRFDPIKPVVVPKPKTEVKPKPKTEVKPPPRPMPKPKTEVKPPPRPMPKPTVEVKPPPRPMPKPKTEVKPPPKPMPKPRVEVKPPPKPMPKPVVKPDPKPMVKPPPGKPQAKAPPRPAVKRPVREARPVGHPVVKASPPPKTGKGHTK